MQIAELEIFHSRPIAPTRRIALGRRNLPIDTSVGSGGLLLAGVVAHSAPQIEPELREDFVSILETLKHDGRVVQPRARHRFQSDTVGLTRSVQRLLATPSQLYFSFDDEQSRGIQLALGALYAAGSLPKPGRSHALDAITAALSWEGPVDSHFIDMIMSGDNSHLDYVLAWSDPFIWACQVLELPFDDDERTVSKRLVRRKFRTLLREAHPDHGGDDAESASRIAELTEARRILLA